MKILCFAVAMTLAMGGFALADARVENSAAPLAAQLEAMRPAMDSVLLAMREGGAYAPDDPAFVWYVLYLMGQNFPASHPDVWVDENHCVVVPEAAQLAFLRAAFAELEALPPMPAEFSGMAVWDEPSRSYVLAGSDRGDSETQLGAFSENPDGSVSVTLSLRDWEGTEFGSGEFLLTPNPDAAMYPFRIQSAK